MAPVPLSLAWAPGERLLASAGEQPSCNLEALPSLPNAFLRMFFTGHQIFCDKTISIQEKSARYRSIIITCQQDLEELHGQGADIEKSKEWISSLKQANMVWHFFESVYLTDPAMDDRHTSVFLTEWYRLSCYDITNEKELPYQLMQAGQPREDDEKLWDVLIKLAIVGRLGEMEQMLHIIKQEQEEMVDMNSLDDTTDNAISTPQPPPMSVMQTVHSIIQSAPPDNISSRSDGTWEEWQSHCGLWVQADELKAHPHARRLVGLLSGDMEGIREACTSWEEMLVSCCLYGQYGMASGGNLRGGHTLVWNSSASASEAFPVPENVARGALVEASTGAIGKAIVSLEAGLPTSWFSAHLCDLLVTAGYLKGNTGAKVERAKRATDLREFYLKEFAREVERSRGCWRIAVDYYTACPLHGTSMLIDFLSRMPFEGSSDPTVEKVLLICTKMKLQRTGRNICEKLGAHCLNQENLGGAMSWFARAGLYKRAQNVAELALSRAETEGADSQAARSLECVVFALTSAGDEKMMETFYYLRVYCEMQQALVKISSLFSDGSTEKLPKYISDLVSSAWRLVSGGGLPRRHWVIVAFEVARVIELHPNVVPLLSRVAISDLLSALQLASGPHCSEELALGIRRRLAFEASLAREANRDDASLSRECEAAMQHCRSVFIRTAATRITAE